MNKKTIYLGLSVLSFFLLFTGIFIDFRHITLFGMNFSVIWLPIAVLTLFLPLFVLYEIVVDREDISKRLVIAICLNIINIVFVIRHFGLA